MLERIGSIAYTLGHFQVIEEGLKMYLDLSFRIIKLKTKDILEFGYSRSDYEDAPLERLLTTFSKLSNNKDLIDKLNKAKRARNYIAHKAIYHEMNNLIPDLKEEEVKLTMTQFNQVLLDCMKELLNEYKSLGEASQLAKIE